MNEDFLLPGAGSWAGRLREIIRQRRLGGGGAFPVAIERKPDEVSFERIHEVCTRSPGERLAYLRAGQGLTLDAAAALTGISKSELSRLETGKRKIGERHIAALASAYDLTENGLRYMLAFIVRHASMAHSGAPAVARHSYDMQCFPASGIASPVAGSMVRRLAVSGPFQFSPDAYCIVMDAPYANTILPVGGLVIVDPRQRALIGDLVLNRVSWVPLIVSLIATNEGLAGKGHGGQIDFGRDARIDDFHKVVAIITSADILASQP